MPAFMSTRPDLTQDRPSKNGSQKSSLDRRSTNPAIFCSESHAMNVGRTILAIVITLAVALLTAASGAGVKSPTPAGMSMMEDMPDCCHQWADPCAEIRDDCAALATCALKCFSCSGAAS